MRVGGGLLSATAKRTKNRNVRRERQKGRKRKSKSSRRIRKGQSSGEEEDDSAGELLEEVEKEMEGGDTSPILPTSQSPEALMAWDTPMISMEGPLIRLHNVTAVASTGSVLTRFYHALAELPFGDADEFAAWSSSYLTGNSGGSSTSAAPRSADLPGWTRWAKLNPENVGNADGTDKAQSIADAHSPPKPTLQPVVIKINVPRQLDLAADDVAAARRMLRRMAYRSKLDLDLSGVVAEVAAAVDKAGDLRIEADNIEKIRYNLARAGMLGSLVVVPQVVSCPELGKLARRGLLVTTALRGVDVSDARVMDHAAARGEKERSRFVDRLFTVFGQMCLADGCFPSNPMPDNLLYMYGGQVGLTDLSAVCTLTEEQRRALCRLYRTMVELKNEDAANPSPAAESKARAAMEGVGLVIDLPPAGGIERTSTYHAEQLRGGGDSSTPPPSSSSTRWTQTEAVDAVAAVGEVALDSSLGIDAENAKEAAAGSPAEGDEDPEPADGDGESEKEAAVPQGEDIEEELGEDEGQAEASVSGDEGQESSAPPPPPPPRPSPMLMVARAPLTHVLILRGLFDTQRDDALDLLGEGCMELMRGMAVRRLPQAMVPVLRMVANLRAVCSHLDVDKSLLPRFSRAASKGLSWRHVLSGSRGGGASGTDTGLELDTPPRGLDSAIHLPELGATG
ncbi:unnamed protein product [Sphacelaria rigidula]